MLKALPSRAGLLGLLAVVFPLSSGCGDNPKILRVTGTVSHAGKPVPNLLIHFVPSQGRRSWGTTDAEGHYKLSYDRGHEGAVAGTHKVFVAYRPHSPKEEVALQQNPLRLPAELQAILTKYGDEATTPLQFEISKNDQVIDLHLD